MKKEKKLLSWQLKMFIELPGDVLRGWFCSQEAVKHRGT